MTLLGCKDEISSAKYAEYTCKYKSDFALVPYVHVCCCLQTAL